MVLIRCLKKSVLRHLKKKHFEPIKKKLLVDQRFFYFLINKQKTKKQQKKGINIYYDDFMMVYKSIINYLRSTVPESLRNFCASPALYVLRYSRRVFTGFRGVKPLRALSQGLSQS